MPEDVRGTVERLGGDGPAGAVRVRIVGGPAESAGSGAVLAAVLAAAQAAHEDSLREMHARARARSWRQVGRLEAMGTDAERRRGLR